MSAVVAETICAAELGFDLMRVHTLASKRFQSGRTCKNREERFAVVFVGHIGTNRAEGHF